MTPIDSLKAVETITLFIDDLSESASFYKGVFPHDVVYEDDVSCVIGLRGLMLNLLLASEAETLIEPLPLATRDAGSRLLLTIKVDGVDDVCEALERRGITLLNGPIDRPWGRRTAAFADPSGHVWEIAQELKP